MNELDKLTLLNDERKLYIFFFKNSKQKRIQFKNV